MNRVNHQHQFLLTHPYPSTSTSTSTSITPERSVIDDESAIDEDEISHSVSETIGKAFVDSVNHSKRSLEEILILLSTQMSMLLNYVAYLPTKSSALILTWVVPIFGMYTRLMLSSFEKSPEWIEDKLNFIYELSSETVGILGDVAETIKEAVDQELDRDFYEHDVYPTFKVIYPDERIEVLDEEKYDTVNEFIGGFDIANLFHPIAEQAEQDINNGLPSNQGPEEGKNFDIL